MRLWQRIGQTAGATMSRPHTMFFIYSLSHTMRINEIYETIVDANIYRLPNGTCCTRVFGAISDVCIHLGVYFNVFSTHSLLFMKSSGSYIHFVHLSFSLSICVRFHRFYFFFEKFIQAPTPLGKRLFIPFFTLPSERQPMNLNVFESV